MHVRAVQSGYSNFTTYSVSGKCANPEAAYKYIEYLNSLEVQQMCLDYLQDIPALPGLSSDNPIIVEASEFSVVGENIYHVLSNVPTQSGKPQDIFMATIIADLMRGNITGEEGVAMIVEEMNK